MKDEKNQKKKLTKHEKVFKRLHIFEKVLFRRVFPYKRHGNMKKYDGPLIIVGNHYSVLDVVFPILATDRPIHFMAKSELWNGGPMKWFAETCECIPVKRDGSDVQAIKTAMRYLKNGEVINIFPEGTRNHSYEDFLPFKGGAAALSIKTRTPILPFVQIKKIKAFRRVDVVYGEPIEFSKYYGKKLTAEQLDECDKQLRDIMINMRQAFIDKHKITFKKKTTD